MNIEEIKNGLLALYKLAFQKAQVDCDLQRLQRLFEEKVEAILDITDAKFWIDNKDAAWLTDKKILLNKLWI